MKEISEDLRKFLKVLADGTRLEIIETLKSGENTSGYLQTTLNKSQSTISQHLKTLEDAGIIKFKIKINENEKNEKHYYIRDEGIFKILTDLKAFISKINKEKIESLASKEILDILH